MAEPRIPVCRPYFWGNEAVYLREALDGGWISSCGTFLERFEQEFARFTGHSYAVATSSGTGALHLILKAVGVAPGDEVIVPDFTMMAPVFAVIYCGGIPVPVDCDESWNMDPELVESQITDRTKGILAVHTYGHPARVDKIAAIAARRGLFLVEDAAEAHGGVLDGRLAGTFGDASAFSFYANKVVTTGEGGIVVTEDESLYRKCLALRSMCFGEKPEDRFHHTGIGFNYRMTNLQAAIGVAQMEHIAEAVEAKVEIARAYESALANRIVGLTLPPRTPGVKNVYWVYGVLLEDDFGMSRESLQRQLRQLGIETRPFFTPLHQQSNIPWKATGIDFPRSRHLGQCGLYLPSFIGMGRDTIDRVAVAIQCIQDQSAGRRRV